MLIVGIDSKEMLPVFPLDSEFTGLPAVAAWVQITPNASAKISLLIILLLARETSRFIPLSYSCYSELTRADYLTERLS